MKKEIVIGICCLAMAWVCAPAQRIVRGPYLQNANHHAITLKWRTDSLTDSRVRFGPSPGNLGQQVVDTTPTYNHTVRIEGLGPDSRYYYAAGTSTMDLEGDDTNHSFRSNPIPGTARPIKIWALGDFGRGNALEYRVRDSYQRHADANGDADVWLWLGDNAYDTGADSQYTQKVFNVFDSIFDHQIFWPTPGNHDYYSVNQSFLPPYHTGPYYNIVEVPTQGEAGGVPSGGEMYYSFDYGNVHLVSLNSELGSWIFSTNTPLTQWLAADLQATQQPWKIVYFHQPPHSKGSHDTDNFWEVNSVAMRTNIMPIVEQYGVDLVLSGHSHVYERSKLMYGFYDWSWLYAPIFEVDGGSGNELLGASYHKSITGNGNLGTIYAVAGNGASSFASPLLNHPIMTAGWGCDTCVGSMIIDVHGDTLRGKFLSSEDEVRDQFTIIKDLTIGGEPPLVLVSDLQVSPNPFSGELEVEYTLQRDVPVRLQILDMAGKELHAIDLGRHGAGIHRHRLDHLAGQLAPGTYLVRISSGATTVAQKIVKI